MLWNVPHFIVGEGDPWNGGVRCQKISADVQWGAVILVSSNHLLLVTLVLHCDSKKLHHFSFYCGCYRRWPVAVIFGAECIKLICSCSSSFPILFRARLSIIVQGHCRTLLFIFPPHLHAAAALPWGICCFGISSDGVSMQSCLHIEISKFVSLCSWPPSNSRNLNPVDCGIWGVMRDHGHQKFAMWPTWGSAWLTVGVTYRKTLWTVLFMNDIRHSKHVWMKQEAISNTFCDN